jgi:hypothetical protein
MFDGGKDLFFRYRADRFQYEFFCHIQHIKYLQCVRKYVFLKSRTNLIFTGYASCLWM